MSKGWTEYYDSLSDDRKAAKSRELQAARELKIKARRKKTAKQPSKKQSKAKKKQAQAASDKFLSSYKWRKIRYQVLKQYGAKCMCCGQTEGIMNVDHIKPRKKYPELALEFDNLEVLCGPCNHGKGNWDETDWRPTR